MTNFDYITCRHVYTERNTDDDHLSKNGLTMEHGSWKFLEIRDAKVYEFYQTFHRPANSRRQFIIRKTQLYDFYSFFT